MEPRIRIIFCILLIYVAIRCFGEDLPVDAWNEITIHPGKTSYTFGVVMDTSRFITYSIHSPFNKIWASLLENCPTTSSQYGYSLGIVNQFAVLNSSQTLYLCSFNDYPVQGAIRASYYDNQTTIPGGCGPDSTEIFATSTIVTHWSKFSSQSGNKTSPIIDWWTSTIRFYSASSPQMSQFYCASDFQSNSTFFDHLVYHIYYVPLVTSGGSDSTFANPTATDILRSLSLLSSYGDAPMHGTLIASIKARKLHLFEDNSHEIAIARHLGTASVVNVIAEYNTVSAYGAQSSKFVAYAPTVLYTCPHSEQDSSTSVRITSDQISCDLLSGTSYGTRFSVGILLTIALLFAFSGSFFVWLRCGLSIAMLASFLSLMLFYRYRLGHPTAFNLVVASILVPIGVSCVLMSVVYCCCIRRTYVQDTVPLTSSIFHPTSDPPTLQPAYGVIGGNSDDDWTINESSAGRYSLFRNEVVTTSSTATKVWCPCCHWRRRNQYRLWRLARLVPVLPAVVLFTAFLVNCLVTRFEGLRSPAGHICFFMFIYVITCGILYIYKNTAFGLSVALIGLYVALTCVALLFFPNSLMPYFLVDEFLALTWPEKRLGVYDISAYGKNDTILVTVWLCGTIVVGLLTMCTVRLSDSCDHKATSRGVGTTAPPLPTLIGGDGGGISSSSWLRRWWRARASRGPFATSTSSDDLFGGGGSIAGRGGIYGSLLQNDSEVEGPPIFEGSFAPMPAEQERQHDAFHNAYAWPPQPPVEKLLAPVLPAERKAMLERQRMLMTMEATITSPLASVTAPLAPISRAQMEVAGNARGIRPSPPGQRHNPFGSDDEDDSDGNNERANFVTTDRSSQQ